MYAPTKTQRIILGWESKYLNQYQHYLKRNNLVQLERCLWINDIKKLKQ